LRKTIPFVFIKLMSSFFLSDQYNSINILTSIYFSDTRHMCTELLLPGGYPIAVKYIISYFGGKFRPSSGDITKI